MTPEERAVERDALQTALRVACDLLKQRFPYGFSSCAELAAAVRESLLTEHDAPDRAFELLEEALGIVIDTPTDQERAAGQ